MTTFKLLTNENFTQRELDILKKADEFFSSNDDDVADQKNIHYMLSIINGQSIMSIRAIDWFLCESCSINNELPNIIINDYKNQLDELTRAYFDPFCRVKKIECNCHNIKFITSIGQLNFFRWALSNGVLEYIEAHHDEICQAMRNHSMRK